MEARDFVAGQSEICLAQLADTTTTTTSPGYGAAEPEDTEPLPLPPPAPAPSAAAAGAERTGPSDEQLFAAYARRLLNLGDAALAEGRMRRARRYWLQAIENGKAVGAQASIMAQKRLQTHTLTCHFTDDSLKAISRDYKARSGDLVHIKVIQQSLHALGHYDGPITGNVGPITRSAIRKFQREMEFDETETLTPVQTVYLVCNAAETARDLPSQNALGIMYATGLGVEQNIDLALEWLRAASNAPLLGFDVQSRHPLRHRHRAEILSPLRHPAHARAGRSVPARGRAARPSGRRRSHAPPRRQVAARALEGDRRRIDQSRQNRGLRKPARVHWLEHASRTAAIVERTTAARGM